MTSVLDSLQPQGELHTIHSDRMDAKMFNDIKEQSSNLQQAEKAGTQVLNTFPPLVQDIWSAMFKFSPEFKKPEEMSPSHRLNATLMEKMLQMPQYRELRVHTRLDDLNSAVATITIAEELTKKLKEELKEQAEHANKAQNAQEQLQNALDAAQTYQDMADKSGNEDFQKKADQMLAKAKKCRAHLTEAQAQLEQSCNANANKIRSGMRAAAESALKNAQSTSEAMDGWGLGGGELARMPIQQKLELAKKLQSAKFKRMAEVIGRMRRLAVHQQKTKLSQSRDEIHTVGIGNDLSRVLPAELVQLRHPLMKGEFKRKFIEGKLMQYELKGTEKQGKGPIIICCDNSGSMAGDREIWSKAVALALLEVATMQKRAFVCIHFGGPLDELKVIEVAVGDKNILTKAVEIAEFFLDSDGTAFEPALTRAAESVTSQAYQKADVVFITDGKAPIAPKFLADFLDMKRRREFRVFGVPIQSHDVATLKEFSDELIRVNELLDAEAEPLLEI